VNDDDAPQLPPRIKFARNRSCLLFGVSWSHHSSFPFRLTHFYIGAWTMTLRTGASGYVDRDLRNWVQS
jgi:hypothetical protein